MVVLWTAEGWSPSGYNTFLIIFIIWYANANVDVHRVVINVLRFNLLPAVTVGNRWSY